MVFLTLPPAIVEGERHAGKEILHAQSSFLVKSFSQWTRSFGAPAAAVGICGDCCINMYPENQRARRCVCGNRSHPEASSLPLPCPAVENLRSNRAVPVCTLPYFVYYRKDRKKPIDSPGKRHVKFWSSASAMPFRPRRTLKKTPAGSDPAGVRFYHFKGDSFRNCRVLTAHNST